ncbi:TPA: hypothetical protein EYP13_02025 [Candidatus Micrarchaeota archaeon]|nr:hypothetical protein [Candidatus Micrarchaeota archaeon]
MDFGLNLSQAFGILIFFYLVGGIVQVTTGEAVTVIQLPDVNNDLIGGVVGLVNAFFNLVTMPIGVINLVDFGIEELNLVVKSVLYIVLAYVYMVVLSGIKDMISPFS